MAALTATVGAVVVVRPASAAPSEPDPNNIPVPVLTAPHVDVSLVDQADAQVRAVRAARRAADSRRRNMPDFIPAVWQRVAACESSGNWADTAGMYFGGLQFSASTWASFDTTHYAATADQATPAEQLVVARRVLHRQGVMAWPECGPKAGLTKANGS